MPLPVPPNGAHPDVAESDYHSWHIASASALKILAEKTPKHLRHARDYPDSSATPAKLLGSAVHCLVLEPKRFDEKYATLPGGLDRRTSAGKATYAEFCAAAAGKRVLSADVGATAREIAASVLTSPAAARVLRAASARELTVISEIRGVRVKCRADGYGTLPSGGGIIADLKVTSGGASERGFQRSMAEYGYPFSAAFYENAFAAQGMPIGDFIFIVAENEPPYGVAVYRLEDASIEAEQSNVERMLALHEECERSGNWPGYPDAVMPIASPGWLIAKNDAAVRNG